jgi:hypothetical protein
MFASRVVGGLGAVGQNKMCCNLCRLVGDIAALFILRRVGILSVVLLFVSMLLCRQIGLHLTYLLVLFPIFYTSYNRWLCAVA